MKAPAALPLFGDAYMADTRHFTLAEHGAYLLLMMIAWRSEGCNLPDNDKRIAAMLGTTVAKWAKMKPVVMAPWKLSDGYWTQGRLTKERKFVDEKRTKNFQAANSRWGGKSLENQEPPDANAYADAMQTQCPYSPTPLPIERTIADAMDGKPSHGGENTVEPIDLKAVLFGTGVTYLTRHGSTDKNARSMLGKWRQRYGDGAVVDALHVAQSEACSDPIPMINKILEKRNGTATRPVAASPGAQPVYRSNPALDRYRALIGDLDDATEADEGASCLHNGARLALS